MANDVLNQDEIDALLHGVDKGAVSTEAPAAAPCEVRSFDFANQVRIVRGRMPTLEITVLPIEMVKFAEYVQSLQKPTNMNMVKILPLRGTGLIVLDPKLVF